MRDGPRAEERRGCRFHAPLTVLQTPRDLFFIKFWFSDEIEALGMLNAARKERGCLIR